MDLEPLKEVHCVTVQFRDAANLPDTRTCHLARPRSIAKVVFCHDTRLGEENYSSHSRAFGSVRGQSIRAHTSMRL